MNTQQLVNLALMVSVFVLVLSMWATCVVLWVIQYVRYQRRVHQRLGTDDVEVQKSQAMRLWRENCQMGGGRDRGERETLRMRLERLRVDAGWKTPASAVLLVMGALAVLAMVMAVALGMRLWIGLAAAGCIVAIFWALTERRVAARIARFERQFLDSLGIAARALRAGHPLVGAFQLITEEVDDPVGGIFGDICQEQALGLNLQDSIQRAADASHNVDLKLFATAVGIQMSSGGNLAELMDTLAAVMRSRIRLHRRVRVLTAQTQMSKRVLIGLPVLLFVMLNITAPAYMESFYKTWTGRYLLLGIGASILLGNWLMRRISVLRY